MYSISEKLKSIEIYIHIHSFTIGPLTRATQELTYWNYRGTQQMSSSVFVVTGILSGQACTESNCSPGDHRDASAYVNLRDPDIKTFLSNNVQDLNNFSG